MISCISLSCAVSQISLLDSRHLEIVLAISASSFRAGITIVRKGLVFIVRSHLYNLHWGLACEDAVLRSKRHALGISLQRSQRRQPSWKVEAVSGSYYLKACLSEDEPRFRRCRSEEHTSELQSLAYLVCRLLLEK